MSKSKCEAALERVTQERDHWRNKAREKDEIIAALQRQIERLQMAAGWFNVTQLERDIDQIQHERDQARADVQRLVDALTRAHEGTIRRMQKSDEDTEKHVRLLNEVMEQYGEPQLSGVLKHIYNIQEEAFINIEGKIRQELAARGITFDPYHYPEACLYEIMQLNVLVGIRESGTTIPLVGYAFANDPTVIADEILRECRAFGKPKMETINKLPSEWLEQHLDNPKPQTLCDALEWIQRFKNSGLTADQFNRQHTELAERTFRKYRKWYDTLEEAATLKPEGVITRLQAQMENLDM